MGLCPALSLERAGLPHKTLFQIFGDKTFQQSLRPRHYPASGIVKRNRDLKKIFLNSGPHKKGDFVHIQNNEYHHLAKVLRVKIGDRFIIGDKISNEYIGNIVSIDKNKITIVLQDFFNRGESQFPELSIFFSVLKGDKNDYLIQKCCEIGVNKFIPVITKNTVVKLSNNENKKILRWKMILREASMQSCRREIPEIFNFIMFEDIKNYAIEDKKFFGCLMEKKKKLIDMIKKNSASQSIAFFLGPEGGFDDNEINMLKSWKWDGINLSPNILRSETSAIFVASAIFSYYWR